MFMKKVVLISTVIITGAISTDTIAVGGSVKDAGLTNVVCENITTGQSLTIPEIKKPASWDCDAAGLQTNQGDTVRATLTGTVIWGTSCKDILAQYPYSESRIYSIHPEDGSESFRTYCDMTADGGGWTLVAKLFERTLPTGKQNGATLVTRAQPIKGQEGKLADSTINALGYEEVRVIPSRASKYVTYFFKPGVQVWDFSTAGAGNLSSIPICEDPDLTANCVTRHGVIDGPYRGYRNYNGTSNHAFIFNHPRNLGYAGRVPYAEDFGISATIWVR